MRIRAAGLSSLPCQVIPSTGIAYCLTDGHDPMPSVTTGLLNDDLMKNELRASFTKMHYAIIRGIIARKAFPIY